MRVHVWFFGVLLCIRAVAAAEELGHKPSNHRVINTHYFATWCQAHLAPGLAVFANLAGSLVLSLFAALAREGGAMGLLNAGVLGINYNSIMFCTWSVHV